MMCCTRTIRRSLITSWKTQLIELGLREEELSKLEKANERELEHLGKSIQVCLKFGLLYLR